VLNLLVLRKPVAPLVRSLHILTLFITAIQVSLLHILVEQHSKDVQGKVRVNWDTVSRLINRRYYDCQNKWNTIKKSNLKVRACASDCRSV
jgi:hypothetical protein